MSDVSRPTGWLRPKGNLTRAQVGVLIAVGSMPLLMVLARVMALPGVLATGMVDGLLPSFGHELDRVLSLHQVQAEDRDRVLYLLFLPTGALLIALARLTFGLRVIGFRAILIALGFQVSGVVPSLILIAVVAAIVLGVRPALVRIRLPYYARVSVIMGIACTVLLAALLCAPWIRSDVLWGVGFFPVIVLGLLAEGIAKTLDRSSGLTALWRSGMTIGIALLLAAIGQIPLLREIALHFPELILTQIVGVVLIAEFLDLRLFQDWDARLSGQAIPRLWSERPGLRVAIVRNHRRNGVFAPMGPRAPRTHSRASVRRIARALRSYGHTVQTFEGDVSLLGRLREFVPPHPRTGEPGGIVLDLSSGLQGELAAAHVPAMLELAGLPFTGPPLHGRLLTLDRITAASLLERAGLRTPERRLLEASGTAPSGLRYPVVVKPRFGRSPGLRVARDLTQLEASVRRVRQRFGDSVVVEPYLHGRDVRAALLGNDPTECLPLVEVGARGRETACPAALDEALARRVRDAALAAFEICGGRDLALVALRVTPANEVYVLEVGDADLFAVQGAFERAGEAAGLDLPELLQHVIEKARDRQRGRAERPASRALPARPVQPEGLVVAG